MKTSKGFVNPTEFFFHQSLNPPTEYKEQIAEFVSKLIDLKSCVLCKSNFDLSYHLPRILIHCGHTFCTPCLRNFYRNLRVRCPLCLKLIKNIENIERLPLNHTIVSNLVEKHNASKHSGTNDIDLKSMLYSSFVQQDKPQIPEEIELKNNVFQKEGLLKNNFMELTNKPSETNPDMETKQGEEELSYCEFHNDRVKHFYCLKEKTLSCRMCAEYLHNKDGCGIVDLYEVEDIAEFLAQAKKYGEGGHKPEAEANEDDFEDDGKGGVAIFLKFYI